MSSAERIDTPEYLRLKSENQRLEQELRQLRHRSTPETILGMRDMLLVVGPSGEVTYANAAAQTHFGRTREEMLGMPITALSSQDLDGVTLSELVRDARAVHAPLSLEVISRGASEPNARVFCVTASPTPTGAQLLISDRSNLRRVESALARYISPKVLERS